MEKCLIVLVCMSVLRIQRKLWFYEELLSSDSLEQHNQGGV